MVSTSCTGCRRQSPYYPNRPYGYGRGGSYPRRRYNRAYRVRPGRRSTFPRCPIC